MVNTGVLFVGWLSTTTMLVSVMLPVFVTVPVKTRRLPGTALVTGHALVTRICGAVTIGQVAVAWLVTLLPHFEVAVAVKVSMAGPQKSSGTV